MTSSEHLSVSSRSASKSGGACFDCPPTSSNVGVSGNSSKASHCRASSVSSQAGPSSQHPKSKPSECFGCHKPIHDRYMLKALEQVWHEDCLKCGVCNCRLGEIGSTLFTKADLILCKRDYLRMFGTTGLCSACNKGIPSFEMVLRAKANVYHLECFKCEACNHRFCVGDRFYLHENKILCEYDYEEQMTYSQMQAQQRQQYYQSLELQHQQTQHQQTQHQQTKVQVPGQEYPEMVKSAYAPALGTTPFTPGPSSQYP